MRTKIYVVSQYIVDNTLKLRGRDIVVVYFTNGFPYLRITFTDGCFIEYSIEEYNGWVERYNRYMRVRKLERICNG